jgi:dethiobiotin synthetase
VLIVCAGTATDVGKTWVGGAALGGLRRRGATVAARKPAQSCLPTDEVRDADVLAAATGEPVEAVCRPHRTYLVPMAPPMAADVLGAPPVVLADLVDELAWPADEPAVRWVEAVGGVRSPIAEDGDTVDLCRALRPDLVVLDAPAALGPMGDVRLAAGALAPWPVVVVLNRFDGADDLHRRNAAWLRDRDGLHVVTSVDDLVGVVAEAARLPG